MGKAIANKNGNDVVMTPEDLSKKIVARFSDFFKKNDVILEPCKGEGSFIKAIEKYDVENDWCEISLGRDFLEYNKQVDFIITNPPFSKIREFLEHGCKITNKSIIFLCLLPNVFYKKRLAIIKENGFFIERLIYIDSPESFPKFGFQLGIVQYTKGNQRPIEIEDWRK